MMSFLCCHTNAAQSLKEVEGAQIPPLFFLVVLRFEKSCLHFQQPEEISKYCVKAREKGVADTLEHVIIFIIFITASIVVCWLHWPDCVGACTPFHIHISHESQVWLQKKLVMVVMEK